MAENKITIELDLDSKKITNSLDSVEKKSKASGEKAGKEYEKGLSSGLGGVAKLALGVGAALAGIFGAGKAIRASAEQQDAIQKLNQSLANTGKFSVEASNDLQEFASSLQNTSKFGDEVILKNAALIQSLGNLDTQGLKRATQASADLATALGVDLTTASTLVGKAASGNVGVLSRYGIQVQKGATDTETFANTLKALEQRFGGSALGATRTFSGSLAQLQNVFGDVLETLGDLVTKSPALVSVFNLIKNALLKAGEGFKGLTEGRDILGEIILKTVEFGEFFNAFVVRPVEIGVQIINTAIQGIALAFQTVLIGVLEGASFLANGLAKLGIGKELAEDLNGLTEVANAAFTDISNDAASAVDSIGDSTVSEGFASTLDAVKQAILEAKPLVDEFNNALGSPETVAAITDSQKQINASFDGFIGAFKEQAKTISITNGDIAKSFTNSLGRGVGNAFSAFGQALAKGENAFAAFGKLILGLLGDLSIQLGQGFILQGIARQIAGDPGGGALIAAGAGLATFGGVLKALAGGGGSLGGSTATTGATGGAPTPGSGFDVQAQPAQEPRASINFTVQGNVFETDETSLRIADLLGKAISEQGASVQGLA